MIVKEISTSRLKEYENNPRNNDLAVEKVKYSIQRFGFLFPVVVDINYVIVCGHTRVRACRELGIQAVPCIVVDDLTEEQVNFFRLVDNKTSEYSDWDFEKLKSELALIDLTLDENQLLLEQFELSAEVFDIEPEQAEIKVAAFNFMGVNDDKPKERKAPVKTIDNRVVIDCDDNAPISNDTAYVAPQVGETVDQPVENTDQTYTQASVNHISDTNSDNKEPEEPKKTKPVLSFCQFRFGDVSFFISQVELDRLIQEKR